MVRRKKPSPEDECNCGVDTRTLAWRLMGLSHFLKFSDPDAPASREELYGIGDLLEECAFAIAALAEKDEI